MIVTTPSQRRDFMQRIERVAVVGASSNPLRPSYTVFSYLRLQTPYDVTPINPTIREVDGVTAYPSLTAYAQARGAPDLVDVFRRPAELEALVNEAIAVGSKAIWFQYGAIDPHAIALADAAGLIVVADRCLKVEHARFFGGLGTGGLNTGIITSRRPPLKTRR